MDVELLGKVGPSVAELLRDEEMGGLPNLPARVLQAATVYRNYRATTGRYRG